MKKKALETYTIIMNPAVTLKLFSVPQCVFIGNELLMAVDKRKIRKSLITHFRNFGIHRRTTEGTTMYSLWIHTFIQSKSNVIGRADIWNTQSDPP